MFYVFYVNDGYMLALDLPPVEHFRDLHQELAHKTGVQPRDQIFFLSNGEALIGDYLISDYSDAGTESNPVYFIKRISSEKDPINSREEEGINNIFNTWRQEVDELHKLPVKATLVGSYCEAGERGLRVAETLIRYCAKIVSEHQYLNQGFIAVTRNLDENVTQISAKFARVYRISQKLPQIRKHSREWVSDFNLVFDALMKIKIPGSLLAASQTGSNSDSDPLVDTPEPISLYDWIESQDPLHTLDTLIEHVAQHIEKLDDTDVKQAAESLKTVKDLTRRKEYREIKGIDKRLAMLDAKLVELENTFGKLKEATLKLIHAQADQNTFRTVVGEQRDRVNRLSSALEQFVGHAHLFLNSKLELLKNVRQRLVGFVRQCYDRLQQVQSSVTLFDEKFSGFRQRMDLVRQIREAPLVFVAAVAECVRRRAFHAEFDSWLAAFIGRAAAFIRDENTTRAEFYVKLEKHFLRDIFKGMGDELPNFCPARARFDTKMPHVDERLLRELRDTLKDCIKMDDMFKVVYPQVFSRLSIEDPRKEEEANRQGSSGEGHDPQKSYFHREASFFVRDKAGGGASGAQATGGGIHSNFPSSTWLSGVTDEHSEMSSSPINHQLFLSRAAGSTTSLNTDPASNVTTPSDLVPSLEAVRDLRSDSIPRAPRAGGTSSVDLSSPTSIHPEPKRAGHEVKQQQQQQQHDDVFMESSSTSDAASSQSAQTIRPVFHTGGDSEVSLNETAETTTSSQLGTTPQFATPMLSPQKIDESQQTFVAPESMIQDSELFKGIKPQLDELVTELKSLQSDAADHKAQVERLFEDRLNALLEETQNRLSAKDSTLAENAEAKRRLEEHVNENEEKMRQLEEEMERLRTENSALKEVIEHEKYLRTEKEKEAFTLGDMNKKLNDDLLNTIQDKDRLQLDLLNMEAEKKRLEERLETDSNAADCLSIELDIVSQILKRDLQTDEIDWIRSEIEKRKSLKKTDHDGNAHPEEHQASSRAEYEGVLRKKMNLIAQGLEEKKNEEIIKLREIIENETKEEHNRFVRKLKERIAELEEKVTFYERAPSVNASTSPSLPSDPQQQQQQSMISSFTSAAMQESCCNVLSSKDDPANKNTTSDSPTGSGDQEEAAARAEEEGADLQSTIKPDEEDEDLAIVTVKGKNAGTQTKLRMNDLKMMVSLSDVSEGNGVILVYSDKHNSYCVFTTSAHLYFVKQRSLRALGIEPSMQPVKSTFIFARIANVELCETKKAPNRYNLPSGSRFYRVDVESMSCALPHQHPNPQQLAEARSSAALETSSTKTV